MLFPSKKLTFPVGVPEVPDTFAVSVTGLLTMEGLPDVMRVIVGVGWLTTRTAERNCEPLLLR